ncbi:MAG: DUF4105 domain-containing protein [Pirellulales bacterium]|nr:DUF4105 domain-containing protein [Pirellulales bacterium]
MLKHNLRSRFLTLAGFACLLLPGCASTQPRSAAAPEPMALLVPLKPDPHWLKTWAPSNDRDWIDNMAVMPSAEFQGDRVTMHDIRNCRYRTKDDYDLSYYDKTFDLNRLTSVDFIVVPFNEAPKLAHTMLSFGFEDQDYVIASVEIRREKGESFNPLKGFFRQYELMYVLADERDLIPKYANHYNCEVYVYRSTATPEQVRRLFVNVLQRANRLRYHPEFYNTLTNNCTTNIRQHINRLKPEKVPYDYRVLLPGYSDTLAFDLGLIEPHGTFAQTKQQARVNYEAYLYRDDPQFSQKIRRF